MANRLSKKAGVLLIPGTPEISARKAGCKTLYNIEGTHGTDRVDSKDGTRWVPSNDVFSASNALSPRVNWYGAIADFSPSDGGYWTETELPAYHIVYEPSYKVINYKYETKKVCWPDTPYKAGAPSRAVMNDLGWDSGAKSVDKLDVGKSFKADVYSNLRFIMLGITGRDDSYSYAGMKSAILIEEEKISYVESGIVKYEIRSSTKRLVLTRYSDRIEYIIDGLIIATYKVSSKENLYIGALLYSSLDALTDPAFYSTSNSENDASLSIETFLDATPRGISEMQIESEGDIYQYGLSFLKIEACGDPLTAYEIGGITVETDVYPYANIDTVDDVSNTLIRGNLSYAHGFISAAGGASGSGYASASGVWPRYELTAFAQKPGKILQGGEGFFPKTKAVTWMLNGGTASVHGALGVIGKSTSAPYIGGTIRYWQQPMVGGWIEKIRPDNFFSDDFIKTELSLIMDSSALFTFMDGVDIADSIDIYLLLSLGFNELILVEDLLSFNALLELMISEQVKINTNSSVAKHEAIQYAVNAVSGAVSRYSNFGFKQFASTSNFTYAINDGGLYKLSGTSDDGDLLSASIDFGASDYGTAQGKRMSSVYAGIATDGTTYIRVTGDNGEEIVYKAVEHGNESRALTAKGITARHWRIRLEVADASYADLDNVEVEIGVSQRRLRSAR
ncbi:MAG: hypothetical protein RBR22_08235 [Desulfuromonas sp.]|nr:hypothetical protein [Desulfuromonas sp.]